MRRMMVWSCETGCELARSGFLDGLSELGDVFLSKSERRTVFVVRARDCGWRNGWDVDIRIRSEGRCLSCGVENASL